jgi:hypothetical protein
MTPIAPEAIYPKDLEKPVEQRGPNVRTILAACNPWRLADSYTEIMMKVWFEELPHPVPFCATPFDCEGHGRELWFRAMKGEYGEIEVVTITDRRLTNGQH